MQKEIIMTIHTTPTKTGKYMWVIEEQDNIPNQFPDWRLLGSGFAESPYQAFKAAMFEANKHREIK